MRPVERGESPQKVFAKYQDAAHLLIERLGCYCSYCERQIETHLAVEHMQPKSRDKDLETTWENFLVSCVHCNSRNGKTDVELDTYLWPDKDNTLLAFRYGPDGLVNVIPSLPDIVKPKAEAMIRLVGLDKYPGHPDRTRQPSQSDQRWLRRQQTWDLAQRKKCDLETKDSSELRECIVDLAVNRGGFSIWFAVLGDDEDMRLRLIAAFAGTATRCFDAQGKPIPRSGECI